MNKHKLSIQEDEDGELFFEIPPQILAQLNWQEGDNIEFIEHSEGLMLRKNETNKINYASDIKIKKYDLEVIRILAALDGIEEGWGGSLLTDASMISDFCLTATEIKNLSKQLRVPISEDDLFVDVAARMSVR